MSELFKDEIKPPGYNIAECIDKECSICKFLINGHCKYGLDEDD